MKLLIIKIFEKLIYVLPYFVIQFLMPLLRVFANKFASKKLESALLYRFAKNLVKNFDTEIKRISSKHKVMEIVEGTYDYKYFNIAYINNIVSLIVYALYNDCIPIIKINGENEQDKIKWEWYFTQPCMLWGINPNPELFSIEICPKTSSYFMPRMHMAFDLESEECKIWSFLFKKIVQLNSDTEQYVMKEVKNICDGEKVLGILMRGTDYVALKPAGHPVQPAPEEILDKAKLYVEHYGYKKIYVATEEYKLFNLVKEQFGADRVLENRRTYYDNEYYNKEIEWIADVHFCRDNDNYWKGLEYLSSLIILSKCNAFIGGNCGGTLFSVLYSCEYEHTYIFNKGYYWEQAEWS